MIEKKFESIADAVSDIFDGATVMIGGFGEAFTRASFRSASSLSFG